MWRAVAEWLGGAAVAEGRKERTEEGVRDDCAACTGPPWQWQGMHCAGAVCRGAAPWCEVVTACRLVGKFSGGLGGGAAQQRR